MKKSTRRTKYQESADGNVEETCEIVPETRRLSRVSAVGLVTFTCCCGHSTPLSLHVSVRFQLKETNISASATLCQHVRKHMVTFRKHDSFYSFVDVIRPKRSRKYKVTFRKHAFLLFPLTQSDRKSTEILGYFLETVFSLVSAEVFRSRGDGNTCKGLTLNYLMTFLVGTTTKATRSKDNNIEPSSNAVQLFASLCYFNQICFYPSA